MGALISFLGGSAFRMIWGEASAWLTKRQDHQHELERIKEQEKIDQSAHLRQLEQIKLQSSLGLKEIQVKADAVINQIGMDAFLETVKNTGKPTGIAWVDAWNSIIRPAGATMALAMIVCEIVVAGWVVSGNNAEVLYAFLGIYVADRSLGKRGK